MKVSKATRKLLALSRLVGVGPATLRKVSNMPDFENASPEELANFSPALRKAFSAPDVWSVALEYAEQQLEFAEKHQAKIISGLDADYPILLAKTKDDPFILFIRGKLHSSPECSVAVIGTRQPTPHGEIITHRITEYFVENRWSVVSGLALGCDGHAHRAAIRAGGHTVAVLAHGLHTVAPIQHRALAEEILESGGALISEYPFGQGVVPQQFVKRDKTQAGLAQGVVMIQSDLKGGSLHASRAALSYGRTLVVPFPTVLDKSNHEPKIQANLMIAEGEWVDKANLLKCTRAILDNLIVLRAKSDYPVMLSRLASCASTDSAASDTVIKSKGSSVEKVQEGGEVIDVATPSDGESLTHQKPLL